MQIKDAPIGQRLVLTERMGDEVRHTHYERADGEGPNHPRFVLAYRLRTTQGSPGEKPRYDTGEYRSLCETDGLITVELAGAQG